MGYSKLDQNVRAMGFWVGDYIKSYEGEKKTEYVCVCVWGVIQVLGGVQT